MRAFPKSEDKTTLSPPTKTSSKTPVLKTPDAHDVPLMPMEPSPSACGIIFFVVISISTLFIYKGEMFPELSSSKN